MLIKKNIKNIKKKKINKKINKKKKMTDPSIKALMDFKSTFLQLLDSIIDDNTNNKPEKNSTEIFSELLEKDRILKQELKSSIHNPIKNNNIKTYFHLEMNLFTIHSSHSSIISFKLFFN